jgi:hypothetical protein
VPHRPVSRSLAEYLLLDRPTTMSCSVSSLPKETLSLQWLTHSSLLAIAETWPVSPSSMIGALPPVLAAAKSARLPTLYTYYRR